jgi:nitrite reductase (NADH) small subunit
MSPIAIDTLANINISINTDVHGELEASVEVEIVELGVEVTGEVEAEREVSIPTSTRWVTVCKKSDLLAGRGVAALIDNHQYAVFLTEQEDLFAIDNRDPFCDANVMARGLIGDRNGEPKVASPMLKQTFSLQTGICFEDPSIVIPTHQIRMTPSNTIEIQVTEAADPTSRIR